MNNCARKNCAFNAYVNNCVFVKTYTDTVGKCIIIELVRIQCTYGKTITKSPDNVQ